MKKLAIMIVAGAGLLSFNTAKAQLGFHINLNFGGVPVHTVYNTPAPVEYGGYDNNDDYYYIPDVEAYYSVPQHVYYYNDGERWVSAAYLPGRYHDFDWRSARHYEIRGDRPFMHNDVYRARYGGNYQRGGGYNNNSFDHNQGGFDRQRAADERGYGQQNRNNDNRDGQFKGGFDNQDRRDRGQYQNQHADQNQNRDNYGQNNGNQYQNGNSQGRGGFNQQPSNNGGNQYQNGNMGQGRGNGSQQPSNNGGNQYQNGNMGQGRGNGSQQPANNGGRDRNAAGDNNHFTANKMGMIRPDRM